MRAAHMSTPAYPITLDVRGRRVLVVGAGPVAERRVRALL
ncbi:NAD(P)-dependent oxidoreductase, partial [Nostocoides australiense]